MESIVLILTKLLDQRSLLTRGPRTLTWTRKSQQQLRFPGDLREAAQPSLCRHIPHLTDEQMGKTFKSYQCHALKPVLASWPTITRTLKLVLFKGGSGEEVAAPQRLARSGSPASSVRTLRWKLRLLTAGSCVHRQKSPILQALVQLLSSRTSALK